MATHLHPDHDPHDARSTTTRPRASPSRQELLTMPSELGRPTAAGWIAGRHRARRLVAILAADHRPSSRSPRTGRRAPRRSSRGRAAPAATPPRRPRRRPSPTPRASRSSRSSASTRRCPAIPAGRGQEVRVDVSSTSPRSARTSRRPRPGLTPSTARSTPARRVGPPIVVNQGDKVEITLRQRRHEGDEGRTCRTRSTSTPPRSHPDKNYVDIAPGKSRCTIRSSPSTRASSCTTARRSRSCCTPARA